MQIKIFQSGNSVTNSKDGDSQPRQNKKNKAGNIGEHICSLHKESYINTQESRHVKRAFFNKSLLRNTLFLISLKLAL